MKIEKHIEDLIGLLKDIRKEPSPAVIGFVYSVAAMHMFRIAFYKYIDPSFSIKHQDFGSLKNAENLKLKIPDFPDRNKLFSLWKEMENKRNELCYGYPTEQDVQEYVSKFNLIKEIIEKQSGLKFDIKELESMLERKKNE